MSSAKVKKNLDKEEKKRLKAQYKLDKKRLKVQEHLPPKNAERIHTGYTSWGTSAAQEPVLEIPWYKNPVWLRAVAAIATLIVAIIALISSFYLK